jgi:hypothetical protein
LPFAQIGFVLRAKSAPSEIEDQSPLFLRHLWQMSPDFSLLTLATFSSLQFVISLSSRKPFCIFP